MAKKKDKSGKLAKKTSKEEASTSSKASMGRAAGVTDSENGIWQDSRFQHLLADPRFRGVPKVQRKVKIDKRFQGMFTDDKFKVKYTVDKYGRPVNKSNAEDLRKFYELDENESSSDEEPAKKDSVPDLDSEAEAEQQERRAEERAIANLEKEEDDLGNDALDSDSSEVSQSLRERLTNPEIDYARGEGRLFTDSSSDEDSDDEDEGPELQIDHVWGELDNDAEHTEESTRRLAVCNMDWDRIRAEDLMVMLSSFLPPGGSILSVKIYPSEFGKERMAEEEVHGPKELVERNEPEDDSDEELVRQQDSDAEEGEDYHMEKLRQYQLNRLRYYYAVVECDSIDTADKVYKECDGIEYESSATRVDLRFIPDDTSFEEDTPSDECFELPDASSYKPRQFTTTALQQAKVDLTWDETALDRRELGDKLSSGQVDKLTDKELRQIVAYSSEEEDSEGEESSAEQIPQERLSDDPQKSKPKKPSKQERIAAYKNLLADILEQEKQEKEQKYEMEMTWNVEPQQEEDQPEQQAQADLTPIEKVIQKRSEKNRQRKEQRRQRQIEARGGDPGEDSDESMVPDGIDLNDAYFAEEFANGDYAPPKTKQDKKKKKKKGKTDGEEDVEAKQQEKELELLLDDGDGRDEKQHFSLTKILKKEEQEANGSKRKRRQQLKKSKNQPQNLEKLDDDFQVNLNDNRFKAVYKSHEFNIDPTHSHYKATKGMQQIIGEKLKRRKEQVEGGAANGDADGDEQVAPKRSKQQLEQNALVKSLKRKIQLQQQGQKL
ncbi:ESF1 homolog [Drosophila erecta]|uniref:Uncharacterized protein n=1 Tax=Drosophila erecta TaxID=7220 RepID=B3P9G8_DROER|nr:ESF1 homolog [Drosophila erecta]EDV45464.1 uncharacterized protein Dere_GG12845 [Drosophila erecta]